MGLIWWGKLRVRARTQQNKVFVPRHARQLFGHCHTFKTLHHLHLYLLFNTSYSQLSYPTQLHYFQRVRHRQVVYFPHPETQYQRPHPST